MTVRYSGYCDSFDVGIALDVGLNEAIIYNHLRKTGGNVSLEDLTFIVPYLKKSKIIKALDVLCEHKLVIKNNNIYELGEL